MHFPFLCSDRKIPVAPICSGVGAACAITMLVIGILAAQGKITSIHLIGGVTLSCGLAGVGSTMSSIFTGGGEKLSNTHAIILMTCLSATVIAVMLVGIATLKGGGGLQFAKPLSISAGIGAAVLGSGLVFFGSWAFFAGHYGLSCTKIQSR